MAKIPKNYWAEDDTTEGVFRIFSYPKYYKDKLDTWLWHHFWAKFIVMIHDPYEKFVTGEEKCNGND